MFNFILSFFKKKYPTGLVPDPRTKDQKDQDYLHEEIADAVVPTYKSGSANLTHYPDENQNQTMSCVAHGSTLGMTKGSPRLSKMFFYRLRANYPTPGMWLQNAGDIAKNSGSCLYQTLPTPQDENMANNIVISASSKIEAAKNKVTNYVQLQVPNDIDKIASIVRSGTPVAILIYSSYQDWAKSYPTLLDNTELDGAPVRHCVTVVDAFIENGKKYLKIQDSAWFAGLSVRYLSEDFIKARVYGAMYFITLTTDPHIPAPTHKFLFDLSSGQQGEEVVYLQKRLMSEGFFPVTQTPTGYFGGITLKAVKDYQAYHGINSTGYVGPQTRASLNK